MELQDEDVPDVEGVAGVIAGGETTMWPRSSNAGGILSHRADPDVEASDPATTIQHRLRTCITCCLSLLSQSAVSVCYLSLLSQSAIAVCCLSLLQSRTGGRANRWEGNVAAMRMHEVFMRGSNDGKKRRFAR